MAFSILLWIDGITQFNVFNVKAKYFVFLDERTGSLVSLWEGVEAHEALVVWKVVRTHSVRTDSHEERAALHEETWGTYPCCVGGRQGTLRIWVSHTVEDHSLGDLLESRAHGKQLFHQEAL